MIELQRVERDEVESTVPLDALSGGAVFRFATVSYTDAMKESLFYMVEKAPELKKGVAIVDFGGNRLVRDGCHRVIEHDVKMQIIE